MDKNQKEMIFIHKPGADNMTLAERINHISLHGQIRIIFSLRSTKGLPDCAIIAWYQDPTKPLNKTNEQQFL